MAVHHVTVEDQEFIIDDDAGGAEISATYERVEDAICATNDPEELATLSELREIYRGLMCAFIGRNCTVTRRISD